MILIQKIRALILPEERIALYFKALALLFLIAIIAGIITANLFPFEAAQGVNDLSRQIGFLPSAGLLQLFLIIFLNNAIKSLVAVVGGILFGIIPVIFILINGYVVGIIGVVAIAERGIGSVLALTLPHGIFEIPAVLLAASYGMMLGEKFYERIKRGEPFRPSFSWALHAYWKIVVPALAVAALIETLVGVAPHTQ